MKSKLIEEVAEYLAIDVTELKRTEEPSELVWGTYGAKIPLEVVTIESAIKQELSDIQDLSEILKCLTDKRIGCYRIINSTHCFRWM